MKGKIFTIVIVLFMVAGVGILLYPAISDYFAKISQTRVVESYHEAVRHMDRTEAIEMLEAAQAYNVRLNNKYDRFWLEDEDHEEYEMQLNIDGRRIIGALEISALGINMPIHHGTNEDVLLVGLGHLEGSSLPVGGLSTHTVITGHRGLPSSELLTNIDRLRTGDVFVIHILGEKLAYQVDQIVTVDPEDYEELEVRHGRDLATLLTCTPYGINTHRLLVRGERIENAEEIPVRRISTPGTIIPEDYRLVAVAVALFIAAVILLKIISVRVKKAKKKTPAKKGDK